VSGDILDSVFLPLTNDPDASLHGEEALGKLVVLAIVLAGTVAGCGRPGFPVPPDDYGIGARMQLERKKDEEARKEQEAREAAAARRNAGEGIVTPPDEITLPDMRPVGGR
jgi:predicted small lipoprotein YifL